MTHTNPREYWIQRSSNAEIARNVAEARLATIQRTGQLALFATQKPDIYKERHGEVIPLRVEPEDLVA